MLSGLCSGLALTRRSLAALLQSTLWSLQHSIIGSALLLKLFQYNIFLKKGEKALNEVEVHLSELKRREMMYDDTTNNNNNNNSNASTSMMMMTTPTVSNTSTTTTTNVNVNREDVMLTPTPLGRACDRVGLDPDTAGNFYILFNFLIINK